MNKRTGWILAISAVVVITCICISVIGVFGGLAIFGIRQAPTIVAQMTVVAPRITLDVPNIDTPSQPASTPRPFPTGHPANSAAADTLAILEQSLVPINDPRDLAERLKGVANIPDTVPAPAQAYQVGDTRKFWASNVDTNENFQVEAVLRYVTDHAYVWVEKGVNYRASNLEKLANEFENKIYPTDRKFFGSEWTPGIDNDPHIYILFARNLGNSIAGYFSSVDELHPLANEFSNANEGFFLNADNQSSMDVDTYSTLAHEFQHMIHWYRDRNEETWMNEGFSVLAELLNQYYPGGFDQLFAMEPDQQLNDWPNDQSSTPSYYGSSFLFVTYFLDRFGEKATQAVIANPDNGLDSVDKVLKDLNITDPQTGQPLTADDVFADWVLANYLRNNKVADGRYDYKIYPDAPQMENTETIDGALSDWETRSVHQYGADYIHIQSGQPLTLSFQGSSEVNVLPVDAHSGDKFFWSNKGDESDMTLSQDFDFTKVSGPIELQYWTWYDLETDYDYLYLVASEDGKAWEIIRTPSSTDSNPAGNSYGWGYSGKSSGWIQEKVDLSRFAGKNVQLRFEYVTDAAVNGEGLMLDDVQIPAINYQADFEKDDGGWTAAGFVRIENLLPQTFRVSLIRNGKTVTVEPLAVDDNQSFSIPLDFGADLRDVVLVVSGTTRFTRQEASYRLNLQP